MTATNNSYIGDDGEGGSGSGYYPQTLLGSWLSNYSKVSSMRRIEALIYCILYHGIPLYHSIYSMFYI